MKTPTTKFDSLPKLSRPQRREKRERLSAVKKAELPQAEKSAAAPQLDQEQLAALEARLVAEQTRRDSADVRPVQIAWGDDPVTAAPGHRVITVSWADDGADVPPPPVPSPATTPAPSPYSAPDHQYVSADIYRDVPPEPRPVIPEDWATDIPQLWWPVRAVRDFP